MPRDDSADLLAAVDAQLATPTGARGPLSRRAPGAPAGAHLLRAGRRRRPRHSGELGRRRRAPGRRLDEHGRRDVTGLEPVVDEEVLPPRRAKLAAEPIEDLRVDFEDGYRGARRRGGRGREPRQAVLGRAAARRRRRRRPSGSGSSASRRPPDGAGSAPSTSFLGALLGAGPLPDGFVVTLPKVTDVEQVAALLAGVRRAGGSARPAGGRLRFELQVETPQAVLAADGTATVAPHGARGRPAGCVGLHYGTYDYSAALRHRRGAPVPGAPGRRPRQGGDAGGRRRHRRPARRRLDQRAAGRLAAAGARRLAAARRAGAPLPGARLLPGLGPAPGPAGHPLRRHLRVLPRRRRRPPPPGCATTWTGSDGGVLDEPATAQALASFVLRGLDCGALDEAEVANAGPADRGGSKRCSQRRALR